MKLIKLGYPLPNGERLAVPLTIIFLILEFRNAYYGAFFDPSGEHTIYEKI